MKEDSRRSQCLVEAGFRQDPAHRMTVLVGCLSEFTYACSEEMIEERQKRISQDRESGKVERPISRHAPHLQPLRLCHRTPIPLKHTYIMI